MDTVTLDRAHGCLLGVALGDAMGMPGELWPRARVVDHFGWIDTFLPGPPGHRIVDGYRAGQVTDDTQQTVMLAEAILDGGGVRAEVVARHLVAWADRLGPTEDTVLGPSSARAIARLRAGEDPRTTGTGGDTNGAAMRIAPVGIACAGAPVDVLVDAVVEASIMSHDTSVAIGGAALVAGVIASAIGTPERTLDEHLDAGVFACRAGLARGELVVAADPGARARLAVDLARDSDSGSDEAFLRQLYDVIGASVATSESVPAAVGILARGQADPQRVAVLAANLGGDTDTIGAIATGMAGAISGAGAIPAAVAATLAEVNDLDLLPTARALLSVTASGCGTRAGG